LTQQIQFVVVDGSTYGNFNLKDALQMYWYLNSTMRLQKEVPWI